MRYNAKPSDHFVFLDIQNGFYALYRFHEEPRGVRGKFGRTTFTVMRFAYGVEHFPLYFSKGREIVC
jgi:hypothetical protein